MATPQEMRVIIHYFFMYEDWPHEQSPAVVNAHDLFVRNGMLKKHARVITKPGDVQPRFYEITEAGRMYVERLASVPFPVQATVWKFPDKEG